MKTPEHGAIGAFVEHLNTVDSTNDYLKRRAAQGAPHGLAVIADSQTGGRGRFGRRFESPAGTGLYLSVLLRPRFPAHQAPLLTPWAAVAVCRAAERLTGLQPAIKWINDILLEGKKLCGILTEADIAPDGTLNHVIIGIGLNIGRAEEALTPEVAAIAASLSDRLENPPSRDDMAAALLEELNRMWEDFPAKGGEYLEAYRRRCVTLGREINVISPSETRPAFAEGLGPDFSLTVKFPDGTTKNLTSGEISIRM